MSTALRQAAPQAKQLTLDLVTADAIKSDLLRQAQAAHRRRLHGAPVQFAHPRSGLTWTGRGQRPAWVKEALDQGMSLDDLRVQVDKGGR